MVSTGGVGRRGVLLLRVKVSHAESCSHQMFIVVFIDFCPLLLQGVEGFKKKTSPPPLYLFCQQFVTKNWV